MNARELALLKTVVYADLFEYPLRFDELCRGLFDVALEAADVRRTLDESPLLKAAVCERDGYLFLRGRDHLPAGRELAEQHTDDMLERHRRALTLIAKLPFVRTLCLSGAAAFRNVRDDDVDLFIIAAHDRAWSACLLVTVLSRMLGVRRTVCANYFVDEGALALAERDFYTAHQLTHTRPLAGGSRYRAFLEANAWAAAHFPAAYEDALAQAAPDRPPGAVERVLALGPGALLERISRFVLSANMRRKIPAGVDPCSVRLEPGRLKLHINDHCSPTIRRFERALEAARATACSAAGVR